MNYLDTAVTPNTTVLETGEKPAVFRNSGIGREYNLKKLYLGLEMGGGIGREAVLRGAVLGGTTAVVTINCTKCSDVAKLSSMDSQFLRFSSSFIGRQQIRKLVSISFHCV